jgi:hypothetical protein
VAKGKCDEKINELQKIRIVFPVKANKTKDCIVLQRFTIYFYPSFVNFLRHPIDRWLGQFLPFCTKNGLG